MNKLLPCPFCGGDALELGDGFYCCAEDDCAGASLDCTAEQWNTRHTPEGWRLVPEWPTHKMSLAGRDACGEDSDYISAYEAMHAAAPKWGGE